MKKFYFLFVFCLSSLLIMGQSNVNNSTDNSVNPRLFKVEYNPANAGKSNPAELQTTEQAGSENKTLPAANEKKAVKNKDEEQVNQEQPK